MKPRIPLKYPFDDNEYYDKCIQSYDIELSKLIIVLMKSEKGLELGQITISDLIMIKKVLPI